MKTSEFNQASSEKEIQIAEPDLVVNAIRAVLDSVKNGGKLYLPNPGPRP
jgi:hypothetical protein